MRDSEIVAAIVASDLDGLAEAYDKYAAGLYGYCRSLLREPADAADAVQDTFVIAAAKVGELRDPGRLRPWLYAVARNECHRRLRAGNVPVTVNGPVSVTPSLLVLASVLGGPATGTLTLSAGNVPVTHYTVSVPASLAGELSVSPASGSIGAGQSTQVTVTLSGLLSIDTTITVNPGGHSVQVLLAASLAISR